MVTRSRRTLLGVEGPDGRPYVVSVLNLAGGHHHALYHMAWGDRVHSSTPAPRRSAPSLAEIFSSGAPSPKAWLMNIGIRSVAAGTWVVWVPTGGRICNVDDAGEVRLIK